MSQKLISTLSTVVSSAHRIVETIVIRAQTGTVFTLEIGESLQSSGENAYGAKATQIGNPDIHLGVCEGSTIKEVCEGGQQLIADSINSPQSAIAKPHISTTARTTT